MAGIIWFIIGILILFWIVGLLLDIVGGLIHILLVIALIMLVWRLVTGRRA